MNLYDLRRDVIKPELFAGIISPLISKILIKKEFYLEKSLHGIGSDFSGSVLRKNYGLKNFHSGDLYAKAKEEQLDQGLDDGYLVLVERREIFDDGFRYPFFIAESGELFCIKPNLYNAYYIHNILLFYSAKVSMYGKPLPTRSNFTPLTREFGPGYWCTIDNDYHALKNLGVMAVNRVVSMGDKGRMFTSEGKDFIHTTRDKIQEWTPLPDYLDEGNKEIIISKSVIRKFGEKRKIFQRYLEGDDTWTQEGKSWHWIPTISDDNYEFKK